MGERHEATAGRPASSMRLVVIISAGAVLVMLAVLAYVVLSSSTVPATPAPKMARRGAVTQPVTPGASGAQDPAAASPRGAPPKPRTYNGYTAAIGRSPMPMPGEKITKPLPFTRLIQAPAEPLPAPDAPVPWGKAHLYIGQRITVEGKVVNTHNTGSVCFLNFTQQWQGQFYVILFKDVLAVWPDKPEKFFLDKTVHVTGKIVLRNNRPQIQVQNKSQIKVVGDQPDTQTALLDEEMPD